MEKSQPQIDTAKLRRLMRQRNQMFDQSRQLTDRFLDLRDEIVRFENAINKPRHIDKVSRDRELARLNALKDERDQLQADREIADASANSYGCVNALVEYARRIGFVVDEGRCTVRRPHEGEPRSVVV